MRIDLLQRSAPVGFGRRVYLEPGVNDVRDEDWAAVRDQPIVRWYCEQGIVVPFEPAHSEAIVEQSAVAPEPVPAGDVAPVVETPPAVITQSKKKGRKRR